MFILLEVNLQEAIYKPQRTDLHTKATASFYKCLVGTVVPAQQVPKQESSTHVAISLPACSESGMEPKNGNGMVVTHRTNGRTGNRNGNVFFDCYYNSNACTIACSYTNVCLQIQNSLVQEQPDGNGGEVGRPAVEIILQLTTEKHEAEIKHKDEQIKRKEEQNEKDRFKAQLELKRKENEKLIEERNEKDRDIAKLEREKDELNKMLEQARKENTQKVHGFCREYDIIYQRTSVVHTCLPILHVC